MAPFEVIEEKRDMIKVRYKGIDTIGYRYLEDDGSRPVPNDKSGPAAWAAQHKQSQYDDRGLVQERNEEGEFEDELIYDPEKDETDGSGTIIGGIGGRPFTTVEITDGDDLSISNITRVIENQQRYPAIPYSEFIEEVDVVIKSLNNQLLNLTEEFGTEEKQLSYEVRYIVLEEDEALVSIDHDQVEYDVRLQRDVIQTKDMATRSTKHTNVERDSLELIIDRIPNEDSLPSQFRDIVEEIFAAVQQGSGSQILITQSVVKMWDFMDPFEVIEEQRDMIKVRYNRTDTIGYRYLEDDGSRPVPNDKSGKAAWAAQFRHDDKGQVQQRNDKGQFTANFK